MHTISEVALKYRTQTTYSEKPRISNPEEAEAFLRSIWDRDSIELVEEFIVVLLNSAKKVLGWSKVSQGSKNATIVDPVTVAQLALLGNAHSVLLSHSHPSGRLEPSLMDIHLTQRLVRGLKLFSIEVDDHLIITCDSFLSFREEGLIKEG